MTQTDIDTERFPSAASVVRRIKSDDDARSAAHAFAQSIAAGAAERDRVRARPHAEIERFSQSGLWAITVPREYGGIDVSTGTLVDVVRTVSAADPSIGQVPQNHFYLLEVLRATGNEAQKRFYFHRVLNGDRFGNALSEIGTRSVAEFKTRLDDAEGGLVLNGKKFYSSGALFAHWIPVGANHGEDDQVFVIVPSDARGVSVIDDWSSFGQRGTGSGTTVLDNVRVEPDAVLPYKAAFTKPTLTGPVGQLIHAAVDAGIAHAALQDTLEFARRQTRPWIDSTAERAVDDPLTLIQVGEIQIRISAADALLERAARTIDEARDAPDASSVAGASVAVAEARALTTEAAILATNKLFELAGTQSTLEQHNLDRHWRNARAHTLHDPVRWKYFAVGNYLLNGTAPPRHGAI
ncbi:SfnB family sulfur acquisition oxidoreductase [Pararobbsia alpina]|uniref:Dibenzothiophene monooxygenase n=1 Tax=Pararobbsia alpina TaxID=621374 RepID=A0A6S7BHB1_9BURK|nr:SfnB family sulfur acquisition oxidoreductase [Pararobbsia alpina]CAB3799989.1 Dibenzothiophene desulfurization enzyme C [Pararobbsia alpina]